MRYSTLLSQIRSTISHGQSSLFSQLAGAAFLFVCLVAMSWLPVQPASAQVLAGQGAEAASDKGTKPAAWQRDGEGFEDLVDPAAEVLRSELGRLYDSHVPLKSFLDRVFTLEHQIPIGGGRHLFVTENFTLRSWLRFDRRAVLFLSGSAFRGNHWNIPVDGYDGGEIIAGNRMFAFNVDFLGVGESFLPADGTTADRQANIDAMKILVRYIRYFRGVSRVDLVGEGYGGSVAVDVAADWRRIRSVSLSAQLYDEVMGGPLTDPNFLPFLESMEDGYFFSPGEASFIFLNGAPQGVFDYIAASQGGFYPTPNFLVAAELPFFDPGVAKVPGLVLYGSNDIIASPGSIERLAADYGRHGATLVVSEQAGHAPRTESPEVAAWFWRETLAFLNQ